MRAARQPIRSPPPFDPFPGVLKSWFKVIQPNTIKNTEIYRAVQAALEIASRELQMSTFHFSFLRGPLDDPPGGSNQFAPRNLFGLNTCEGGRSVIWIRDDLAPRDAFCTALHEARHSRESGASQRTLRRGFHERFGVSPKMYLHAQRLIGARRQLRESNARTLVSDIANLWGFWHMGQFAADYRKLFGERPSETLNRRAMHPPLKGRAE